MTNLPVCGILVWDILESAGGVRLRGVRMDGGAAAVGPRFEESGEKSDE